jgi:hypothetical protein
VAGKGSCRKAARIATSGTSTEDRLAAAKLAGRLSSAKAVLLGLQALSSNKGAPSELRGDASGPGGEQAAIKAASSSYGSLPLSVKKQVLPFFVPPSVPGSAWQVPGRNTRIRRAAGKASAAASGADCSGYDSLEKGIGSKHAGDDSYPWAPVPTSDHKAIFWYGTVKDPKLKHLEVEERAAAEKYASVFPYIWKTLTKEFGQPQSDAKEPCYHGPDGRLDIYVGNGLIEINGGRHTSSILAITVPYPKAGKFCTNRPAWIMARAGLTPFGLAHEFMHVLQFSHRYVTCDPPIGWWDEGSAHWAGDFVYPDDNFQRGWPEMVADPLATNLVNTDYGGWPFWMMLQRTQGTGVLRSIFAQLGSQKSVQAVNAAIPGGYAKQIPLYYLAAYNQSPVGDAGFEIPQSFAVWDKWNQTPAIPAGQTISLGSEPADTLLLKSQRTDGFPALSVGAYHRVDIPDKNVKEIKFTNDLADKPGAHVDAMLHMADGSWKLADWTGKKTVTLCRDIAGQNVSNLVIVSTNTSQSALPAFTHTLRVANGCGFPTRFDGTWTRVYTWSDEGSFKETINGNATLLRASEFPPEADQLSAVPYIVQTATVNWSVTGSMGTSCPNTFSGSGTDTPIPDHSALTTTDLQLENVTGHPGAPSPEPSPFYYSIRSAVQDFDPGNAPMYDITDCHGDSNPSPILIPFFELGYVNPIAPGFPVDKIAKSADPRLLAGHRVWSEEDRPTIEIDDTWSFKGSD